MSPKDLREAAKQDIARVKELDALYRPLREAGEARLARTKSGRKALEETRAFGMEQAELYTSIGAGKTPYEEGHRLARHRQEDFRQRYEEQLIEAQAPDARLQPSVEAVAQILAPEFGPQTHWIAETAPLRALLLQPKPAPEDLGRVSQGLGDPAPEPVSICRRYPYSRREEYPLASGLTGEVLAVAELDGKIDVDGWVITGAGVPQGVIGSAWLGHDFDVPEGIFSYSTTVEYDFLFGGFAYAVFGVSTVNLNVGIFIDKGDQGPGDKSVHSVCLMIVPFAGGDYFGHGARVRVTIGFRRASDIERRVRVMVGCDGHCTAVGLSAFASFRGNLTVREICLNSTV